MARRPDPKIMEVLKKFGFGNEALWDCHGTWVIYHNVLEKIAAQGNIKFDRPQVLEAAGKEKIAAICVFAKLGDHEEWSIGEAAPGNNKNAYPWAMAEKRAKDRVILKLIGLHGLAYSEEEADDFKQRVEEEADHRTPEAVLNDFLDRVRNIEIGNRADFEFAWKEEKSDLSKIQRTAKEAYDKFITELHTITHERQLNHMGGSEDAPKPAGKQEPDASGGDKVAIRAKAKADALVQAVTQAESLADASRALMNEGLADIDDGVWRLDAKTPLAGLKELAPDQFKRVQDAYNAFQKKDIAA